MPSGFQISVNAVLKGLSKKVVLHFWSVRSLCSCATSALVIGVIACVYEFFPPIRLLAAVKCLSGEFHYYRSARAITSGSSPDPVRARPIYFFFQRTCFHLVF